WLSNWIVTPILRLGYWPLTFWPALRTRRAGGDERIRSITTRAASDRLSRWHQSANSSGLSMGHDLPYQWIYPSKRQKIDRKRRGLYLHTMGYGRDAPQTCLCILGHHKDVWVPWF